MIPEFKKKQKSHLPKNKILFVFVLIIFLIVLCFLIFANIKIYQKKQELNLQLENLKQQIEEIKKSNNALQEGIKGFSDSNYVEKVAREQLGLQKENENTAVFLIPKPEVKKIENQNQKMSWLANLWQSVINIFK